MKQQDVCNTEAMSLTPTGNITSARLEALQAAAVAVHSFVTSALDSRAVGVTHSEKAASSKLRSRKAAP